MSLTPYLSCKQVASLLGVSQSTIKRLCDDAALSSIRTPGGHRRISQRSVEHWLKSSGHTLPPAPVAMRETAPMLRPSECVQWLLSDRRGDLFSVIQTLRRRFSLAELCDSLFAPALVHLGEMWPSQVEAYQVHNACQRLRSLLLRLADSIPSHFDHPPTAVGATATGDWADLSSLLAEITLRELGWDAESIGASLPAECIARAARERGASLVWVSYTHIGSRGEVVEHNRMLSSQLAPTTRLAIGGSALSADLRRELVFSFFGDSLEHLSHYVLGQFPHRSSSADAV